MLLKKLEEDTEITGLFTYCMQAVVKSWKETTDGDIVSLQTLVHDFLTYVKEKGSKGIEFGYAEVTWIIVS